MSSSAQDAQMTQEMDIDTNTTAQSPKRKRRDSGINCDDASTSAPTVKRVKAVSRPTRSVAAAAAAPAPTDAMDVDSAEEDRMEIDEGDALKKLDEELKRFQEERISRIRGRMREIVPGLGLSSLELADEIRRGNELMGIGIGMGKTSRKGKERVVRGCWGLMKQMEGLSLEREHIRDEAEDVLM